VGGFSLFLILIFNIFYPIFINDPELDFGINNKFETNYDEWAEDLENKVDLFRKKQFPQEYAKKTHKKWTIPNKSIFTFTVNEIGRINELNSTIRIKGTIEAEYYPDDIKTPYFFVNPITKMAKNDVLSIADLNFASTEERRFERLSNLNVEADGYLRSKYRFEGEFPLERDLRKFPFDSAIWRVRLILPISAAAISPDFGSGTFQYSNPKMNAYDAGLTDCGTEDGMIYNACNGIELISRNEYFPEEYSDKNNENYYLAQQNYNLVLSEYGVLNRSIPSSFTRYIVPILFSILVLSITDQLNSKESWEIKIAIPPTVLLTLIFMQNTYHSVIPQLAYITWLDKLYLIAYLAAIIMLINAIATKGDWFNNKLIDEYSKLKLIYFIRISFIFVVTVLPIILFVI
tara:strand:- start:3746 stop:4954 length:1209 start_codon:yes stop_codon:yes gene_type:complete